MTWCQAVSLPMYSVVTTSTSKPFRCSRRFSARTVARGTSVTEIGRYRVMTFSTCTAPRAENGKSNPVMRSITVGNVSAKG